MKSLSRLSMLLVVLGTTAVIFSDSVSTGFQTTARAASLPGTATLSGIVDAPKPFQAGQVYIRNQEKRMLYMVYTNKGRYRAAALFPGTYEVTVAAGGMQSEVKKVAVKSGDTATLNLTLQVREGAVDPRTMTFDTGGNGGVSGQNVETLPFEKIYPPGPAFQIVQRTCITCHGPNFLPSKRWNAAQWNAALDLMLGKGGEQEAKRRAGTYLASTAGIASTKFKTGDRETILPYLVANFGPNAKLRRVLVTKPQPIDETLISNSIYIEYYFPHDPPGQGTNAPEYYKLAPGRGRWGQAPRFDKDGNVWMTDRGFPNRMMKLDPRTGAMTEYPSPNPVAGIHDLLIDANGIIWSPEHFGAEPFAKKYVNALDPKSGKWTRYLLDPENVIKTPDGSKWPQSLARDSQGNIYVGWINGGAFSRIDVKTKKVTVFPAPVSPARFYGVAVDKHDTVWAPYYLDGRMAQFDPKTGKWEAHSPSVGGQVRRPVADHEGNIWFGIWSSGSVPGKLVKVDVDTKKMTEYDLPHENACPYDVAEDPAGNMWIADAGQGGTIIKFDRVKHTFTYYPSPQVSDKPKLEITKDGAIWYSPRQSTTDPGYGVLFPDMDKIATLAAYPQK